jgi:hypothetical protein
MLRLRCVHVQMLVSPAKPALQHAFRRQSTLHFTAKRTSRDDTAHVAFQERCIAMLWVSCPTCASRLAPLPTAC